MMTQYIMYACSSVQRSDYKVSPVMLAWQGTSRGTWSQFPDHHPKLSLTTQQ